MRNSAKSRRFSRTGRPPPRSDENRDVQLRLVKEEFSRAKDYSSEYDQGDAPIAHFFNMRLHRVCELLGDFDSGRVLDAGCGPARIAGWFRGKPIEYYGVDISEEMIKECIKDFGGDGQFNFTVGNIGELPFSDSYFDVVLCLGTFEYLLDSNAAMDEIARTVKPGGIVIISMLNARSPYRAWQRFVYWRARNVMRRLARATKSSGNGREQSKCNQAARKRPLVRLYSERSLKKLLESKRFDIEDSVYYDFNLFLSPADTRFPGASVYLSRKLETLSRSKLRFLGTGYILKGRKSG